MSVSKKNSYAFKIINCKLPHWQKGKIVKEEGSTVMIEGCMFPIKKEDVYTNEKEALMDFVRVVDACNKNNVEGMYGEADIKAYLKGKQLLLKEKIKESESYEQTED